MKFLDLTTGLPKLWQHVLTKIEEHNKSTSSHNDIRSSISTLTTSLGNKVDKNGSKQLSTNDFTDAFKTKLEGLEKITIDNELSNSSSNPVENKVVNAKITEIGDKYDELIAQKGKSNGIAPLSEAGIIDTQYLPSYVDDVLEYETKTNFPTTGENGKIYVDKTTNLTYRWSGTDYIEISPSLALGETSSTAYRGDYGKIAYDHAQAKGTEVSTKNIYEFKTNAEGHITEVSSIDSIKLPYTSAFGFQITDGISAGQMGYQFDKDGLTAFLGESKYDLICYDYETEKMLASTWKDTGSSTTPVYFNSFGLPEACSGSMLTDEQVARLTSIRALTEEEINAIFQTEIVSASEVEF